ncbi:MAG: hypothetical protein HYY97_15960 [Rhodocyclales bacterium]|nr:hypothetical protein [Rhodocyclales bacterium]
MSRESKSAFARRLGVAPSYVTKLKDEGRIVVVDGQVEVEASLARMEATKDPNRDDVRQRHAKARDAKRLAEASGAGVAGVIATREGEESGGNVKTAPGADSGGREGDDEEPEAGPVIQAAEVFRKARTAKMHFESRRAVIRVARLQGRLADMATIRKSAGNDGASLRSLLENLPDQAAPRLAPVRDAVKAAAILGELLDDVEATMAGHLAKNIAAMRETEAV